MFSERSGVWYPAKIVQISNPYSAICYSFIDEGISSASKNKLSSFLNYGCRVDFDLLDLDETYRGGILACISSFAEIHRPDLLQCEETEIMLLDWARLGFIGCKLIQKSIPQILVDYEPNNRPQPHFCEDSELPSSSQSSPASVQIKTETREESETFSTPKSVKKRKLSQQTVDSGYGSPGVLIKSPLASMRLASGSSSEIGLFVLGKLARYGWWPGSVSFDFLQFYIICSVRMTR